MLTRMRVRNFKAWKDSGDVRLAPLTVLFGANSAGKTSIPQLLLLLKQTAESPDRKRALQLGDSRTLVDLGTYEDVVHNHDIEQPLDIEIDWTLGEPFEVADPLSKTTYQGEAIDFKVSIRSDKRRRQPMVTSLSYELRNDGQVVADITMKRLENSNRFDLSSKRYNLVRHHGRAWPVPEPLRFYGFPDEATAYYQNTVFASDFVLQLELMLRSLYYVGPLREYPQRLYLWSGELPDHVGERGDRAIEAILAGEDRAFNFKPKQRTTSLAELVAKRLSSMGLIHDFKVHPLGTGRKEYEVLVRTSSRLPTSKTY